MTEVRRVRDHFSALLSDVMHLFPKCFQTCFQNVLKNSVGVSVSGFLCVCENMERMSK